MTRAVIDAPPDGTRRWVALTRVYHFSAAHRLESPLLGAEENAEVYGACHRLHGHNYYLEVTVGGVVDAVTGMAVDLGVLDAVVARTILDRVDHRDLDQAVPELKGVLSTGENLARAFWGMLAASLPTLRRVAVVETAKNRFAYCGGEAS